MLLHNHKSNKKIIKLHKYSKTSQVLVEVQDLSMMGLKQMIQQYLNSNNRKKD